MTRSWQGYFLFSLFLNILGCSAYKIGITPDFTFCLHRLFCQILNACDCISEYTGHFARKDPVTSI